jgi:hypothetical protein
MRGDGNQDDRHYDRHLDDEQVSFYYIELQNTVYFSPVLVSSINILVLVLSV